MPEQSTRPPASHDDPLAALLGRISAPWWVVILSVAVLALILFGPLVGIDLRTLRH